MQYFSQLKKPLGLEDECYEYYQPENWERVYLVCCRCYFCINRCYGRNIGVGQRDVTRLFQPPLTSG